MDSSCSFCFLCKRKYLKKVEWDLRILAWKNIARDKKVGLIHKMIQVVAKLILAPIPVYMLVRKLDRDVKKYSYDNSQYVGHFVTKAIWGSDIKPKEYFENPVRHTFEEGEFYVPGQVEAYLTQEYGDYMQLPPEEKRVAKHDFVAYYK